MTRTSIASGTWWLAAGVLLTACAAAPLGIRSQPVQLQIANPERLPLRLEVVVGDEVAPIRELGTEPAVLPPTQS